MSLAGRHIVHIACSPAYSAAVTNMGEVYIWGGSRSAHSAPSSDSVSVPTLVTALHGLVVVDVACGNADSPILILTSQGEWTRESTTAQDTCRIAVWGSERVLICRVANCSKYPDRTQIGILHIKCIKNCQNKFRRKCPLVSSHETLRIRIEDSLVFPLMFFPNKDNNLLFPMNPLCHHRKVVSVASALTAAYCSPHVFWYSTLKLSLGFPE